MRFFDKTLGDFAFDARDGNLKFCLDSKACRDLTYADCSRDRKIFRKVDFFLTRNKFEGSEKAG